MSEFEATKLGEKEDFFKNDVTKTPNIIENFSLKGTIIGSESEFEQSLKETISEKTNPEDKKPASEPDTETQVIKQEPIINTESKPEPKKILKKEIKTDNQLNDIYNLKEYSIGDYIKGTVINIEKSGIFVDLNYKCEGFISNEELTDSEIGETKKSIKEGDVLNLMILKLETKEGYTLLSKKRADWELSWQEMLQFQKSKEVIDVEVINAVRGGLVVSYKGLHGFMPASLVKKAKDEPLNIFIGKTIKAKIMDIDKKRKKVILSNKLPDQHTEQQNLAIFDELEAGQTVKGKVTSIKDFGAFVNINGAEGLIHISELSWDRINKVEDILKVGDEIDVFILGVDKEEHKISLGLKQLTPDPWDNVYELYPIGTVVKGTISRLASFGAFTKLEKGLEGLIHISEISKEHVKSVEDAVKIGQEVEVKIIRIIPEEQKIGLSIKQALESTEISDTNEEENNQEVIIDNEALDLNTSISEIEK